MRSSWYRGRDGNERLWLAEDDIENMMDDELHRAGLFPTTDNPVVNLERFIEGHLGARLDQHAQLEAAILGQTEFFPGRTPHVLINRNLTGAAMDDDDGAPGVVGRWRATMAHEASHIVMHRALFELDQAENDLFGAGPRSQRLMRCFKANVLFRGGGNDSREVQANLGMAALLMPRTVFRHVADGAIRRLAIPAAQLMSGTDAARRLIGEVAALTRVSKQAAEIRLETTGIISLIRQSPIPWG